MRFSRRYNQRSVFRLASTDYNFGLTLLDGFGCTRAEATP
jgi:hypothetical protein